MAVRLNEFGLYFMQIIYFEIAVSQTGPVNPVMSRGEKNYFAETLGLCKPFKFQKIKNLKSHTYVLQNLLRL